MNDQVNVKMEPVDNFEASMGSFVPEGTPLGKRPSVDDVQMPGIPGSKKKEKKKKEAAEGSINPVMRLNEIRCGLHYVVESTTGPPGVPDESYSRRHEIRSM
jgi:hypothetical protein